MVNTGHYWTNKKEREKKAKDHTNLMASQYKDNIKSSIKNTKIYDRNYHFSTPIVHTRNTFIDVPDLTTTSAIFMYRDPQKKMAVLNFSSYKNPGGMFLNGSKAQEECLCHSSFLYNVLSAFQESFYNENKKSLNKSLYRDKALYSKDIKFIEDGETFSCDVITCAAPNKSSAQKYCNVTDEENTKALKSRIKFVLNIARENKVDTLILGAYGCGVFGQDPTEVANIFKEYLENDFKNCFNEIVFAIPDGEDGNLEAFENVFKE